MAAGLSSRALLLSINNAQQHRQQHHCCQTFSLRRRGRRRRSSLHSSALPLSLRTLSRPTRFQVICQSTGLSDLELAVQVGQDRLRKVPVSNIRNFCIIAHIDHGKSTLADKLLQMTGTVQKREMKEQFLDNMDLERERGITIKLQAARMRYVFQSSPYCLNLIDTPGHVDFSYEKATMEQSLTQPSSKTCSVIKKNIGMHSGVPLGQLTSCAIVGLELQYGRVEETKPSKETSYTANKFGTLVGDWSSLPSRGSCGVSLWKHARKEWDSFATHTRFLVGNGCRVRFWHDVWCGDIPLRCLFPKVFSLACCKDGMVVDYLSNDILSLVWEIQFFRSANDWELAEFTAFYSTLYAMVFRCNSEDRLVWMGAKDGVFTVREFYSSCSGGNSQLFPWRGVWRTKVSMRVSFFVWEAMHSRNLMIDNLGGEEFILRIGAIYKVRDPLEFGIWFHMELEHLGGVLVSRSLAACEGALLVVDASQGVEAQTLANVYLALENNLEIIPVNVWSEIDRQTNRYCGKSKEEIVENCIDVSFGVLVWNVPFLCKGNFVTSEYAGMGCTFTSFGLGLNSHKFKDSKLIRLLAVIHFIFDPISGYSKMLFVAINIIVLNKIDLPGAEPDRVVKEIEEVIGLDCSSAILCSAKEGIGIIEILDAIVKRIPPPKDTAERPLRALIFDSYYDPYRGVIVYFRVIDGTIKKGDRIYFMASGKDYFADEIGVLSPNQLQVEELFAGEVGYFSASIRSVADARVGDTITHYSRRAENSLPGYAEATPMVFCGLFPVDAEQFPDLRDALEKLQLNDAALKFEPETSVQWGLAFDVDSWVFSTWKLFKSAFFSTMSSAFFVSMEHLPFSRERLEREYNLSLITTAPSVVYRVNCLNGDTVECSNPSLLPEPGKRRSIEEPIVKIELLTPKDYIGSLMELAQDRRGDFKEMKYITENRASLTYELPLAEMVGDFFDQLKSRSKGYASMEYTFIGYKESELLKLDIQINGDPVEPLSTIVHRDKAYAVGRALTQKLKELIPRQMFKVPIQACIGAKVIASETLSAIRKDVLSKCYGGDITRKKKLLKKQAEGKKRMKAIGKVDVPQEAFMAVLKLEKEGTKGFKVSNKFKESDVSVVYSFNRSSSDLYFVRPSPTKFQRLQPSLWILWRFDQFAEFQLGFCEDSTKPLALATKFQIGFCGDSTKSLALATKFQLGFCGDSTKSLALATKFQIGFCGASIDQVLT
ncbi:hypothetical protein CJ030_MR6G006004 [Morella rubra]|uniref:Translation factor GUF1 homolog, mitochondrial n=1 Tax=Morella rubra TaxID=262757 RepID=A0A6A1VCK3_9ROSI|nr:hypothetical protein CJ030_MR6G006004 [Morella rubra]